MGSAGRSTDRIESCGGDVGRDSESAETGNCRCRSSGKCRQRADSLLRRLMQNPGHCSFDVRQKRQSRKNHLQLWPWAQLCRDPAVRRFLPKRLRWAGRLTMRLSACQHLVQDRPIGFGELQLTQFVVGNPAKRGRRVRMIRKPGTQHATPKMQLDIAMRIRMFDRCKVLSRNDQQSGFLATLPDRA